jgi:hypothetical protein
MCDHLEVLVVHLLDDTLTLWLTFRAWLIVTGIVALVVLVGIMLVIVPLLSLIVVLPVILTDVLIRALVIRGVVLLGCRTVLLLHGAILLLCRTVLLFSSVLLSWRSLVFVRLVVVSHVIISRGVPVPVGTVVCIPGFRWGLTRRLRAWGLVCWRLVHIRLSLLTFVLGARPLCLARSGALELALAFNNGRGWLHFFAPGNSSVAT